MADANRMQALQDKFDDLLEEIGNDKIDADVIYQIMAVIDKRFKELEGKK